MKPRQRLLRNLQRYHLNRVTPETDTIKTECISKVLRVISMKIKKSYAGKRSI
jgi:hypothetical protein